MSETSIRLMHDQIKELLPQSTKMRVLQEVRNGVAETSEIADNLGIASNTVRRHLRTLAREGTLQMCQLPETISKREADTQSQNYVLDSQVEVLGQLKEANETMWDLVERIEKQASDREGIMTQGEINAYIRAMGEIRNQLQLQANLMEMMLRVQTIKDFQEEVLLVIEGADPEIAQRIKIKLLERRSMKGAVTV